MSAFLYGIDLGGTKTEGVVLHSETLEVLFRERVPTEASKGYDHILGRIKFLTDRMIAFSGSTPSHIGIGTPGARIPDTGLMKNCNTTILNGKPLKEDIESTLGIPVSIANDANCFTLAETRLGIVAKNYPDARIVFGVIMGTGVGGGIVVDGKIIEGRHGIAGEWGHNPLDDQFGPPCYCGRKGCVETILSGPALERYYNEQGDTGFTLKEIDDLARSGSDPVAEETMSRLITNFGKAIAVVINILDPDVIVLGGGVGNIDRLYTEGVEEIKKHVFNDRFITPVVRPALGDSAGVLGAALL